MQETRNILRVYRQASEEDISTGKGWYKDAKDRAQIIADKHKLPLHVVVGVIAALSPTNKWYRNLKDAKNLCSAFIKGDYMETVNVCTYKTMKVKAWDILKTVPRDNKVVTDLLKGPKITDFFLCIMGEETCVIDGHAWCIANNDRRSMQEVPNIGKAQKEKLQEAYRRAAKREKVKPYEMQAITWTTWRKLHNIA